MRITTKVTFETNDVRVGDQISLNLPGFGLFTATAQKVTDDGFLFLFDDIVAWHCMNETNTNVGGFKVSDMKRWLNKTVLPAFPEDIRSKVKEITLPTYGETFGHDYNPEFYKLFEPDNDEQFELMKRRRNRVCDFNGTWAWWWLRNPTKQEVSSTVFAHVNYYGIADYVGASFSCGVRPEFWLVR